MREEFNNQILQAQLETQEQTLHKVSEEIHDNIGQLLSSTKMLLGIAERDLESIPDTFKTAEETLGKAIQDLRALSRSLNKEWLHQFNIIENLKAETERINTARHIQAEFITSTQFLPLQADAQVMLFRIVQEALQNSIKHADAQHIFIKSSITDTHISIAVEDDGRGISGNKQPTGVGILNMQHRTRLLGGNITWNPMPVQGTQVLIHLPYQQENL